MIESAPAAADPKRYAGVLAHLRRKHADDDHIDRHSTLERLPTADELAVAIREADVALIARSTSSAVAGYGLVWSWREDDGTAVHLLDSWAVPGPDRSEVEAELLIRLEESVRATATPAAGAVLGANCRSTEPGREAVLRRLGFRCVFDMVEMQFTAERPARDPRLSRVVLRAATPDDAAAVAALTERVWAGRPFFSTPGLEATRRWLTDADPELYLLAEHDSHLIGLASAKISTRHAEIDDVQVDPAWQRKGVATRLVSELVNRLGDRTSQPIRLHTEGHDPAGARSLYERLGFEVVSTHRRYRKALR